MMNIYNENRVCNLENVKRKLFEIMKECWSQDVESKSKLQTHALLRNSFL